MSNKLPTVWSAEPHTIAKISILKNYLNAWFPIVGSRYPSVVYVDGFSGPGTYKNHAEGSPVAALRVFKSWILKEPDRIGAKVIACFIESSQGRYELLRECVGSEKYPARLEPISICGEFQFAFPEVLGRADVGGALSCGHPLLLFADPFGGTGVPFQLFRDCLSNPSSELLLNFDADGIARIWSGRNPNWIEQLDEMFGGRDWEKALDCPSDSLAIRSLKALELYKRILIEDAGCKYVWSFEMRGKNDRINYYLVFATGNRLGMEKMKEAMRAIDTTGTYSFSDAHYNQHVLFRGDDIDLYSDEMHKRFLDMTVSYEDLDNYALCETPFLNPKAMLETLSRSSRVTVVPKKGEVVRAHSFPEDRIQGIFFHPAPPQEVQGTLF
ncbi:MAG: three-Cys-motif partner protein TcmP [Verrucomicrobia bacterium]|nr:three-Cys-motif partner protein TcmP [Verrucomicrobiota bacterium]